MLAWQRTWPTVPSFWLRFKRSFLATASQVQVYYPRCFTYRQCSQWLFPSMDQRLNKRLSPPPPPPLGFNMAAWIIKSERQSLSVSYRVYFTLSIFLLYYVSIELRLTRLLRSTLRYLHSHFISGNLIGNIGTLQLHKSIWLLCIRTIHIVDIVLRLR